MPATSTLFPDALDARFADLFDGEYTQLPDLRPKFFTMVGPGDTPQKQDYRTSSIGVFANIPEFSGTLTYQDIFEGYDGVITPRHYASGFEIERVLFEDDQSEQMDDKPRGLGLAYARTIQTHAAAFLNNAFSVDTTWNSFTENVALCSNSHTTRNTSASTTSGFDNLVTAALNTVSLVAMRIQFRGFRDDAGNRGTFLPNMLIIPVDLCQQAYEIIESMGVPEDANNAANYNQGRYTVVEWEYLTDVNNFFIADERLMKQSNLWYQRIPYEFAMVEDFDSFSGKWRVRARHGQGHRDWRFLLGAQVA